MQTFIDVDIVNKIHNDLDTIENKSICTQARRSFHHAKYLYKLRKTDINKQK
jgi:hypothetical protein